MNAIEFIKNYITEEMFLEYLSKIGAKNIRKIGDVYRSTCPIHKGNNDTTFTFNPEKMLFNCFSECGGGDIFDLVAMMNDLDVEREFVKVVRLVSEEFNIDISNFSLKDIEYSYKKETMEYLKYITGKNDIYNPPFDITVLGERYMLEEYRGLKKDLLIKHGVTFAKDLGKICFEIKNEDGEVIGASLRALGDEKPKWIHRPKSIKTGMILYNLDNVLKKGFKQIIVVEGIMDCLNLINQGIDNVVCTFGDRITEMQKMILLKHFEEIVIGFDNDLAGMKAKKKCIEKLRKMINTKVLLYDCKDPGEIDLTTDEMTIIDWYEYELD